MTKKLKLLTIAAIVFAATGLAVINHAYAHGNALPCAVFIV